MATLLPSVMAETERAELLLVLWASVLYQTVFWRAGTFRGRYPRLFPSLRRPRALSVSTSVPLPRRRPS